MIRRLFLALLVLAPLGAIAWGVSGADRSFAVYPAQQLPLIFDHDLHLEQEMRCTDCHEEAEESSRAADRLLPAHPECEDCHDIEAAEAGEETDPPASCETCHAGFVATAMKTPKPVVAPTGNLKFDHEVHVSRDVPCARCHGAFDGVALATRRNLPKMETCLECHHAGGDASGACGVCHLQGPDGRLAKFGANGAPLVPEAGNPFGVHHTPDYARSHGHDAFVARQTCNECHAESDCLACHDAAVKSLKVHPNDWITLHPVVAKHQGLECQSCHNYQSFCASCHERVGLGPSSAPELRNAGLRVHPEGWVTTPGPNHHGIAASRDIAQCASCHREESCIQCHASTSRSGVGTNPHPPGFASQCGTMWQRNARVCLKCHAPADGALARCR